MAGGTAGLQEGLEAELERLKKKLKMGYELKVRWVPSKNLKISGEVKGETVYIYDEEEELALETLRHEFIDYGISKIIEPYKEMTNRLIALINDDAYRRKEKLVEALSQLLNVNSRRRITKVLGSTSADRNRKLLDDQEPPEIEKVKEG